MGARRVAKSVRNRHSNLVGPERTATATHLLVLGPLQLPSPCWQEVAGLSQRYCGPDIPLPEA